MQASLFWCLGIGCFIGRGRVVSRASKWRATVRGSTTDDADREYADTQMKTLLHTKLVKMVVHEA